MPLSPLGLGFQGILEQAYEPLVFARAKPDVPPAVAERGASELVGRPELPSDLGRVHEGLLGGTEGAAPGFGVAKGEQQLAANFLVAPPSEPERREGHPIQAGRLLVGEQRRRAIPGTSCVVDRPPDLPPGPPARSGRPAPPDAAPRSPA